VANVPGILDTFLTAGKSHKQMLAYICEIVRMLKLENLWKIRGKEGKTWDYNVHINTLSNIVIFDSDNDK